MKIIIESNDSFEWDETKNKENLAKHGVSFEEAQQVFEDPCRLFAKDIRHSTRTEIRYKCIGKLEKGVCIVRFTFRDGKMRIFGAGYWRKERKLYEQKVKNR